MTTYNETLQNVLAEYQRATSLPSISKVVRDRITTTYGLPAGWGKGMEQNAISLEAGQAVLKKFLEEQAKTKPPTDGGGGTTPPPSDGGSSVPDTHPPANVGPRIPQTGATGPRQPPSTGDLNTLPNTATGTSAGGTAGLQPISVNLITPTAFNAALTQYGLAGKVAYNAVPKAVLNNYTMWYEYLRSLREQYGDLKPVAAPAPTPIPYRPPIQQAPTTYRAPVLSTSNSTLPKSTTRGYTAY